MRLSRKITGEFIGVFLIGAVVGGMAMWDWAAIKENMLIGLVMKDAPDDVNNAALQMETVLTSNARLSQFMARTNDPDVMIARITEKYRTDYHFSPEELDRIQPLIKEMAQNVSQVRRQFGVDIVTTLDSYHQKIAEQLSPEHRAAYETANAEHGKQIRTMLLIDQGSPPPTQKQ